MRDSCNPFKQIGGTGRCCFDIEEEEFICEIIDIIKKLGVTIRTGALSMWKIPLLHTVRPQRLYSIVIWTDAVPVAFCPVSETALSKRDWMPVFSTTQWPAGSFVLAFLRAVSPFLRLGTTSSVTGSRCPMLLRMCLTFLVSLS